MALDTTTAITETEDVRRITVRTLDVGRRTRAAKKAAKDVRIVMGVLYGVVNKTKTTLSATGEELELMLGTFRAVTDDGVTEAMQCVLPGALQDSILDAWASGDGSAAVEFALEIGAVTSKGSMGWAWAVVQIVPPTIIQPLERLSDRVAQWQNDMARMKAEAAAMTVAQGKEVAAKSNVGNATSVGTEKVETDKPPKK